jgi:hypothetical protein
MSATPPIPMFSGSVLTSIKGAAIIHHDGVVDNVDVWGHVFWVRWSALGSPNIVTKCTCAWVPALVMIDLAPTRTWQKQERDRWRQTELASTWSVENLSFFLVYVD